MHRTTPPDVAHMSAALLDEAFRDLLVEQPDPFAQARFRRKRVGGTLILLLACLCIAAIVALPLGAVPQAVGMLSLGALAVVLLVTGAWLIDRAAKQELGERREGSAGIMGETLNEPSEAIARRQRQFGISMLVLAAFCVCVAVAPWPGKERIDVVMWTGFSIVLIATGAWQIERAYKAARRAQELTDVVRRKKSAQAGNHLRQVP
jgi:membrane protein implicated in regulation of membrane protease activity